MKKNESEPKLLPTKTGGFHKLNTMDNLFTAFYGFQTGGLLVEVVEVRNSSKSNIYCELECERQKFTTQTLSKEQTSWHEEFSFDIQTNRSELVIQIGYWKRIGKGLLGTLSFPIKDLAGGALIEGWYPVKPKGKDQVKAEISLKIQYSSAIERNREYTLAKENYPKLIRMILSQDIIMLATLCRVYESEELSKTIIRIFNSEGQALRLLIQLIYRDLKATKAEVTLFRNDSMATKTTRNYFKMIAPDYLRELLQPLIAEVAEDPAGYEIDPAKLGPENSSKLSENVQRLRATVDKYLTRIIDSVNGTPVNMRRFFNLLRQLIRQCFPNSELKAIGSFLFLRFICPAIIAPNGFNVWDEQISPEVRRVLTLITKVLQNLANNLLHFKEPQMEPLTPFLTENRERILKFYEVISTIPQTGPPDAPRSKLTEEDKIKGMSLILGQLNKNFDAFQKALPEDPRMKDPEAARITMEYFEQVKVILGKK